MHPAECNPSPSRLSRTHRPRGPIARPALAPLPVILAFMLASAAAGAPADEAPQAQRLPGLERALGSIAKTFRERSPAELAAILPETGKVFVSLSSLGGGAGYFGRGQVHFILDRVFSRQETIRFAVTARRGPPEPREEGPAVVWCLGIWSFRRADGMDDERQIHFILTCQKGLCHVMEIREVR